MLNELKTKENTTFRFTSKYTEKNNYLHNFTFPSFFFILHSLGLLLLWKNIENIREKEKCV